MQDSFARIFSYRHTPAMVFAFFALLSLLVAAKTLTEFKSYHYIGGGVSASNTVTVSGTGEVFAVPDIATFTLSVDEKAKTVADAQTAATAKINKIFDYLKGKGIAEKDIKTLNYNVNPTYEYQGVVCSGGYCPPGKSVLTGYEVNQTLSVKVRDTKQAGTLLTGVGGLGVSNVSGLDFTIDDQDKIEAQARKAAITDAKQKARVLSDDLGVRLVRIVSFSESGSPYPIFYADKAVAGRGGAEVAPPAVPAGENKITSNVSITYEIR